MPFWASGCAEEEKTERQPASKYRQPMCSAKIAVPVPVPVRFACLFIFTLWKLSPYRRMVSIGLDTGPVGFRTQSQKPKKRNIKEEEKPKKTNSYYSIPGRRYMIQEK